MKTYSCKPFMHRKPVRCRSIIKTTGIGHDGVAFRELNHADSERARLRNPYKIVGATFYFQFGNSDV